MFRNINQTCAKLNPGRYEVIRKVKVGTVTYSKTIECNNPAWGFRQLDEWEHQLMLQDQDGKESVAA